MENLEELDCDIIIIGASIAGNYLAYLLSKKKYRIIIIEEHENIGFPFQCAGIVSKKISHLIKIPSHIILNQVKIAKLISPSGTSISLKGEESPYILDRIALDKHYYNQIKDLNNVTYLLGEKFKSFEYYRHDHAKFLRVTTSKRTVTSKMLIGCDGPLSLVARQLGIKNQLIFASQVRIKAAFNMNEAVMIFHPAWKELFGWIVPEGNGICRIGLACKKHPASKFKNLLKFLNLNEKEIINQQGGIIPYGMMNRLAFDHVLLLGDAAGQVKATTGGGIIMLLTAAKFALQSIEKCFQLNDFSHSMIKEYYQDPCYNEIGYQLKLHYLLRLLLQDFTMKDYDLLFKIIKTAKIEQLINLYGDMDYPKELFFKLIRNPAVLQFLLNFLGNKAYLIPKILKILIKKFG